MSRPVEPLAPNKIHSLPVQVSYHLQSSSQTFSTVFTSKQQVYVHPNAGSKVDGQDEAWGAIYLKTVIQGIMLASPELHPNHPGTPDLSLYVLDPRETYLRRSRAAPVSEIRSEIRSSPPRAPPGEVWTGKGLVSWALDEPSQGSTLITGRIVRRHEFAAVGTTDGVSGLQALADCFGNHAANDGQAWGIEISLGLKSAQPGAPTFPLPLHPSVESGQAAAQSGCLAPPPKPQAPSTTPSHPPRRPITEHRPLQHAPSIGLPRITTPARTYSTSNPPSSAASASSRAPVPSSGRGRPRKRQSDEERTLSSIDMNVPHPSSTPTRAGVALPKAEDLTQEKVKELLNNGAFLQMLEQITGAPLPTVTKKDEENVTKRARFDDKDNSALKCSNCSTTRSSVWRTKKSDDGASVRVCNACGLWYNKTRTMRPKEFWTTGDEEPVRRGRAAKAKKEAANKERALKRTLTQVVEKDAQRIADQRKAKAPPPPPLAPTTRARAAPPPPKVVPKTSPTTSAPKTAVRNAKFAAATNIAASSPGGWAQPLDVAASTPASTTSAVVAESPNAALRRLLDTSLPSLAMPLSDDAPPPPSTVNWNTDLSAFFNVDGFAMPGSTRETPRVSELNVSSAVREQPDDGDELPFASATSDDDVFSQLFQRTSSMGDFDLAQHSQHSSPFDFSNLPPSSPPSLPANLPHSVLLLSSPSASPHAHDYSPSEGKISPARRSGLRNEVRAEDDALHELLAKFENGTVNDDLLALFNAFPAASPAQ